MKTPDNILTIEEVELLCRLYHECRLSVLEETELQLLLTHSPFSSPIIDETRALMNIALISSAQQKPAASPSPMAKVSKPRHFFRKLCLYGSIASVLLIIGVGLARSNRVGDHYACISYFNGVGVSGPLAERQIEAEFRRANALVAFVESTDNI